MNRLTATVCSALAALLVACAISSAAPPGPGEAPARFADRPLGASPGAQDGDVTPPLTGPSAGRVLMSLAGVALLIVGLGWACRRMLAYRQPAATAGVTLLSRSLLTPRHQVLVLRVGRRLLVVGDSGHGMNLLCQITDPHEAAVLLGEHEEHSETGAADFEEPPLDDAQDFAAAGEVRSIIERLRGLAGQAGSIRQAPSETVP